MRTFFLLSSIILASGLNAALAQNTFTGDWHASTADNSDKIQLSLERRSEKGGRNQMGSKYEFSDLQGLTRHQAMRGGAVSFSLVREAGRVDFEGTFQDGKGSGTFRFTGNSNFLYAMKSRGFDFEQQSAKSDRDRGDTEDRLFTATMLNVTTAMADDLASANLGVLGVGDLFKAAIFKVDSQFAREMKASGFPKLGMEDLVKARIFKIDPDYVSKVNGMGLQKLTFEQLVKMRIFKITPEYISEVRGIGFADLSVEELVKLRIFNIDSAFIREATSEGVPLNVEKLVQRRIGAGNYRSN